MEHFPRKRQNRSTKLLPTVCDRNDRSKGQRLLLPSPMGNGGVNIVLPVYRSRDQGTTEQLLTLSFLEPAEHMAD